MALFFIMADCYVVALAPVPSSHCPSRRHCCNRIVIVTAHPHVWRNPFRRRNRQKKSIFIYGKTHLKKANLDQVFSKSRSGTITHKKKELRQSLFNLNTFNSGRTFHSYSQLSWIRASSELVVPELSHSDIDSYWHIVNSHLT